MVAGLSDLAAGLADLAAGLADLSAGLPFIDWLTWPLECVTWPLIAGLADFAAGLADLAAEATSCRRRKQLRSHAGTNETNTISQLGLASLAEPPTSDYTLRRQSTAAVPWSLLRSFSIAFCLESICKASANNVNNVSKDSSMCRSTVCKMSARCLQVCVIYPTLQGAKRCVTI